METEKPMIKWQGVGGSTAKLDTNNVKKLGDAIMKLVTLQPSQENQLVDAIKKYIKYGSLLQVIKLHASGEPSKPLKKPLNDIIQKFKKYSKLTSEEYAKLIDNLKPSKQPSGNLIHKLKIIKENSNKLNDLEASKWKAKLKPYMNTLIKEKKEKEELKTQEQIKNIISEKSKKILKKKGKEQQQKVDEVIKEQKHEAIIKTAMHKINQVVADPSKLDDDKYHLDNNEIYHMLSEADENNDLAEYVATYRGYYGPSNELRDLTDDIKRISLDYENPYLSIDLQNQLDTNLQVLTPDDDVAASSSSSGGSKKIQNVNVLSLPDTIQLPDGRIVTVTPAILAKIREKQKQAMINASEQSRKQWNRLNWISRRLQAEAFGEQPLDDSNLRTEFLNQVKKLSGVDLMKHNINVGMDNREGRNPNEEDPHAGLPTGGSKSIMSRIKEKQDKLKKLRENSLKRHRKSGKKGRRPQGPTEKKLVKELKNLKLELSMYQGGSFIGVNDLDSLAEKMSAPDERVDRNDMLNELPSDLIEKDFKIPIKLPNGDIAPQDLDEAGEPTDMINNLNRDDLGTDYMEQKQQELDYAEDYPIDPVQRVKDVSDEAQQNAFKQINDVTLIEEAGENFGKNPELVNVAVREFHIPDQHELGFWDQFNISQIPYQDQMRNSLYNMYRNKIDVLDKAPEVIRQAKAAEVMNRIGWKINPQPLDTQIQGSGDYVPNGFKTYEARYTELMKQIEKQQAWEAEKSRKLSEFLATRRDQALARDGYFGLRYDDEVKLMRDKERLRREADWDRITEESILDQQKGIDSRFIQEAVIKQKLHQDLLNPQLMSDFEYPMYPTDLRMPLTTQLLLDSQQEILKQLSKDPTSGLEPNVSGEPSAMPMEDQPKEDEPVFGEPIVNTQVTVDTDLMNLLARQLYLNIKLRDAQNNPMPEDEAINFIIDRIEGLNLSNEQSEMYLEYVINKVKELLLADQNPKESLEEYGDDIDKYADDVAYEQPDIQPTKHNISDESIYTPKDELDEYIDQYVDQDETNTEERDKFIDDIQDTAQQIFDYLSQFGIEYMDDEELDSMVRSIINTDAPEYNSIAQSIIDLVKDKIASIPGSSSGQGRNKKKSSDVHTISTPKEWGLAKSKKFILDNGWKITKKPHLTKNFYRFRQLDPKEFKSFSTKKLDNGVELIIGYY